MKRTRTSDMYLKKQYLKLQEYQSKLKQIEKLKKEFVTELEKCTTIIGESK
jgi:hypothetical protein